MILFIYHCNDGNTQDRQQDDDAKHRQPTTVFAGRATFNIRHQRGTIPILKQPGIPNMILLTQLLPDP